METRFRATDLAISSDHTYSVYHKTQTYEAVRNRRCTLQRSRYERPSAVRARLTTILKHPPVLDIPRSIPAELTITAGLSEPTLKTTSRRTIHNAGLALAVACGLGDFVVDDAIEVRMDTARGSADSGG